MCLCLYFFVWVCACEFGAHGDYKMMLDALDLELQVALPSGVSAGN